MILSLEDNFGYNKDERKKELIDSFSIFKVVKNKLGGYDLLLDNLENVIAYNVKSYSLLEEKSGKIYLKIKDMLDRIYVLELEKNPSIKEEKKEKYILLGNQKIEYVEKIFDFTMYSKNGKFECSSIYDSFDKTCYIVSGGVNKKELSLEDLLKIKEFFNFKEMLLGLLNNSDDTFR